MLNVVALGGCVVVQGSTNTVKNGQQQYKSVESKNVYHMTSLLFSG